jgi:hypothetical protein
MKDRRSLLESISATINDYRVGEIETPTPEHVDRWVRQFNPAVQERFLHEIDHVFKCTYFNNRKVGEFLANLVKNEKLVGIDPCTFWRKANFLRIQKNGHSQEEMLNLFSQNLWEQCGVDINSCGSNDGAYIYLDDVVFSGNRVGNDLQTWITTQAPETAIVHIITIGVHTGGEWLSGKRLKETASTANKKIEFHYWRSITIENRKARKNISEVLWPIAVPENEILKAYLAQPHKYPFIPREKGGKLKHEIFTSEEGRQTIEHELLLAGVRIRALCKNPADSMRPLGYSHFGLGFGSMIVTFRNCPNNCPLALWWGEPSAGSSSPLSKWYPLFPRKTYEARDSFDGLFI